MALDPPPTILNWFVDGDCGPNLSLSTVTTDYH